MNRTKFFTAVAGLSVGQSPASTGPSKLQSNGKNIKKMYRFGCLVRGDVPSRTEGTGDFAVMVVEAFLSSHPWHGHRGKDAAKHVNRAGPIFTRQIIRECIWC